MRLVDRKDMLAFATLLDGKDPVWTDIARGWSEGTRRMFEV